MVKKYAIIGYMKIMKPLWENLSQNCEDIPSPKWHEESLKETSEKVKKGLECSSDWTTAKKELRKFCGKDQKNL
jgi:hypothetical protein